ncbi:unnamed protein product [Citrullus colocynthis]|uniref:Uncharacterized protein n=1 Tax=Citrullus colocynthis TaxID=252529 RepID=A0ABP0YXE9_9ROSI
MLQRELWNIFLERKRKPRRRHTRQKKSQRGGGGAVVVGLEESRPGALASTLKQADDMAGQTFNDVGRMDDEEVPSKNHQGKISCCLVWTFGSLLYPPKPKLRVGPKRLSNNSNITYRFGGVLSLGFHQ